MYNFRDAIKDMLEEGELDNCTSEKATDYLMHYCGMEKENAENDIKAAVEFKEIIEDNVDENGNINIPAIPLLMQCKSVMVLHDAITFITIRGE